MNSCDEQSNAPSSQTDTPIEVAPVVETASESNPPGKDFGKEVGEFLKTLDSISDIENKVQAAIDFLEKSISQSALATSASAHLRNFWEVRKYCLELFKNDALSPTARVKFWNHYIELSQEAKRLKESHDAQSAFHQEQIEMAIKGLEDELNKLKENSSEGTPFTFSVASETIEKNIDFYATLQKELSLLNFYAARINALRKELIKTDMRIRHKNNFSKDYQRQAISFSLEEKEPSKRSVSALLKM